MRCVFASLWHTAVGSLAPCEPSGCPYCPGNPSPHWTGWGSYRRWAQGRREKIDVGRKRCRIVLRTFSLLSDGLLPYQYLRAAEILKRLWMLLVEGVAPSTCARREHLARTSLRRLKSRFSLAVPRLRLPGQEGALGPTDFLRRLLSFGTDGVAKIFRAWKELEPKHSILGFYRR
jgi:hypothetical protein